MKIAGCFRVVQRKDRFECSSNQSSVRRGSLDIRILQWNKDHVPLLLVNAPRKSGTAVARNVFRRRVRMAFLTVLRKRPFAIECSFILWVRPSRRNVTGCRISYKDIEEQIESSLGLLRHP